MYIIFLSAGKLVFLGFFSSFIDLRPRVINLPRRLEVVVLKKVLQCRFKGQIKKIIIFPLKHYLENIKPVLILLNQFFDHHLGTESSGN